MAKPDYTRRCTTAPLWVVAVLVAVSLVPAWSVGGVRLRRANILSEVVRFDAGAERAGTDLPYDEAEFEIDLEAISEQVAVAQEQFSAAESDPGSAADSTATETCYVWELDGLRLPSGECACDPEEGGGTPGGSGCLSGQSGCDFGKNGTATGERTSLPDPEPQITPIEDFDSTGCSPLERLYQKCARYGTRVRIAFLGDSFVEGDILTADLREQLQTAFGGCGCGFAPAASPLTGFRRTVKTTSRGWSSYNIMQRRTTPAELSANHIVSGWVCRPERGASTRWECTSARRCIDSCREANLLFMSRKESRVEVTVNDSLCRTFTVTPAEVLRRISVRGTIRSVEMKVLEGQSGFIGYGAQLGGDGVVVDNFSIRSNNGQAMFWSDAALNAQLDHEMGGYDLVILQYGLNIMQNGVDHYTNYATQLGKMIAYVRQCFPGAAVLVMGVSDRSTRSAEGGFVPMQAARGLTQYQREAARTAGAAFWSTYDAMQQLGGMARFVEQGWAGKDYTHINYAGGREVATALYRAICREVCRKQQELRAQRDEELNRQLPEVQLPPFPLSESAGRPDLSALRAERPDSSALPEETPDYPAQPAEQPDSSVVPESAEHPDLSALHAARPDSSALPESATYLDRTNRPGTELQTEAIR